MKRNAKFHHLPRRADFWRHVTSGEDERPVLRDQQSALADRQFGTSLCIQPYKWRFGVEKLSAAFIMPPGYL